MHLKTNRMLIRTVVLFVSNCWSLMAVGSEISDSCAAEPPCSCYKQKLNSEMNPGRGIQRIVDCSSQRFSAVPFFKQLENVTFDNVLLQGNRIAVVPTDAFVGLSVSSIDLSANKIDMVESDAFKGLGNKLRVLDLSSNRLLSWPVKAISVLSNLETLDLSTNPDIFEFPANSFKGLISLKTLRIGNCQEGFSIHPEAFVDVRETLEHLTLKNCSLTKIPEALKQLNNLKHLRLENNLFSQINQSDFDGLESLTHLYLSNNRNLTWGDSFSENSFAGIAKTLEHLKLNGLHFPKVPEVFEPLSNLKTLDLSKNNLSTISHGTLSPLKNLKKLFLNENPLDFNPGTFYGLSMTLIHISINRQNLTRLPNAELTSLRSLETVCASDNNFYALDGDFTVGISAIDYHLENSSITGISPLAFSGKSTQVSLNLQGNLLRDLNFATDPCYFSRLDVSNNPIHCDCSTYKLSKYPHLLLKGKCAGPQEFTDLEIGSSQFDQLMYWQCMDHFFEDTKLCSKWWINGAPVLTNHVQNIFLTMIGFIMTLTLR